MNSLSAGCKQLSRTLNKANVKQLNNVFRDKYLTFIFSKLELQLVYKRHSGNFRQLLKTDVLEICEILKTGGQLAEFATQWVIPKGISYHCPFSASDLQVKNLTYASKPTSILPLGVFRFIVKISDDLDAQIFSITGSVESRNLN